MSQPCDSAMKSCSYSIQQITVWQLGRSLIEGQHGVAAQRKAIRQDLSRHKGITLGINDDIAHDHLPFLQLSEESEDGK